MAKIILNVSTDISQAKKEISSLKSVVDTLGKSFNNIKADKNLTSQIQALTKWNKSLADAANKVAKANNNQAKSELQLERYRSQTIIKAKQQLAEGEEKIANRRIKNAQETAKLKIQEEKLAQEQKKTAKATKEATDETEKQTEKTKNLVDTLMQFSVTSKLLNSGLRLLKSALKDINETLADTEKRIIAIQRVLPDNSVGDKDLANRLYDLAIEYGQSFANVSDIATAFARSGQSYEETLKSTEAALVAVNVAELDVTQATDGLIAIMAQFGLQASDMISVVDKLDKVADRFPVTTEKLMSALQRMGSSASLAGLSLDETIGIATTLSKATGRSGANIGTAANALIQYSTKASALETYSKLSPEVAAVVNQYKIGAANVLDIWQALSKEINNLTYEQSEKLDVLAEYFTSGEGSGLKDELESELGDIFNDITGVFSTANTFRKNYFISLLKDMDTVGEAAQTALTSEGYAIKENEKEMQTYERRVTALEEHWHKIANDEQGFLAFRKGLVEIADKMLSIMEWTGGLRTAVLALGTAFGVLFAPKIIASAKELLATLKGVNGAGTAAIGWIGLAITAVSTIIGLVEQYNEEQHQANLAAIESYQSNKSNYEQLKKLYDEYKELNPQTSKYRETEQQIVELLGSKASVLNGLTENTNEYRVAVEKLTEAELENYYASLANAASASASELVGQGIAIGGSIYSKNGRSIGTTANERIARFYKEKAAYEAHNKKVNELISQGKVAEAERLRFDSSTYDALKPLVEQYFSTHTELYAQAYIKQYGKLRNKSDANKAYDYILRQYANSGTPGVSENAEAIWEYLTGIIIASSSAGTGAIGDYKRSLEDIGNEYSKIVEDIDGLLSKNKEVNGELEKQQALEEAIAKAKQEYISESFEAYLNGLEVENTITEKQQSIEEARLAVEEKRQAVKQAEYDLQKAQDDLEYARRNRSERVFNAATGMWEYQANKKNVEAAQEKVRQATEKVEDAVKNVDKATKDVEKAIDSLTDYLKKQAIAEIKNAIAAGDYSNAKIAAILTKWFGEDGGGSWGTGIQNAIATAVAGSAGAAASNAAVISAQDALKTYQQDQFYGAVSALFGGDGAVNVGDVNKIIEEYRKRGVSEDAINAVKAIVTGYLGSNPWATPSTTGGIHKPQEVLDEIVLGHYNGAYNSNGIISGVPTGGSTGAYTNNTSSVTNNTKNYTVNGIPIAHDVAERYTLSEIFNNFDLVR